MSEQIISRISTLREENGIGILTIANGKKNLLSEPEFVEFDVFRDWIAVHPNLKALIIRGEGKHFSHGADTTVFANSEVMKDVTDRLEAAKRLLDYIEALPLITVAAIHGGCFGGGLEIALSCQFRIASPKTYFAFPEVNLGVMPGMAGVERITRLLGKEKAMMICLSGDMLNAREAKELGLITKIAESNDEMEEAMKFVRELSDGRSVSQVRNIVETINLTLQGDTNPSEGRFHSLWMETQK